jgi:Holliday junction resolvase RusA-like endonuclease
MEIQFTIPGAPVAKGRGRTAVVNGHGHVYTPQKTRDAEMTLTARAMQFRPPEPLTGALHLSVAFVLPIPASWSRVKRATPPHHVSRPDLDNLVKLTKDALSGAYWLDDRQIVSLTARKGYGAVPHTAIYIREL